MASARLYEAGQEAAGRRRLGQAKEPADVLKPTAGGGPEEERGQPEDQRLQGVQTKVPTTTMTIWLA